MTDYTTLLTRLAAQEGAHDEFSLEAGAARDARVAIEDLLREVEELYARLKKNLPADEISKQMARRFSRIDCTGIRVDWNDRLAVGNTDGGNPCE